MRPRWCWSRLKHHHHHCYCYCCCCCCCCVCLASTTDCESFVVVRCSSCWEVGCCLRVRCPVLDLLCRHVPCRSMRRFVVWIHDTNLPTVFSQISRRTSHMTSSVSCERKTTKTPKKGRNDRRQTTIDVDNRRNRRLSFYRLLLRWYHEYIPRLCHWDVQ